MDGSRLQTAGASGIDGAGTAHDRACDAVSFLDALRLRRAHALTRGLLLVAIAAALVGAGGHVLHVHAADSAGLYNEQHVLDAAAALSSEAPVPSAPATGAIADVVAAAPPAAPAVAPTPALRRADSRAPPAA